jgi:hypothetical protein
MSGNLALEHWWVLVAPVNGVYTMSTCGSSYDTQVVSRSTSHTTLLPSLLHFDSSHTLTKVPLANATVPFVVSSYVHSYVHTVAHCKPFECACFQGVLLGSHIVGAINRGFDCRYVYVYTRLENGSVGEAVARCDDCGPCGLQSVLSTALTSGTFWIVMGGYLNHSGTYQLEIVCPTSALALGTLSCGGAGVQGNTTGGVSTIGHDAPEHYYSFVARWNGVRYCSRLNPDFSLVLLLTWIVLNMGSVGNSS